ncbi:hypothetical protein DY000_02044783 [Brassica cretica]|uniref:DUF4283 domain-containing protein n=1 Tax=Brassica cretica TaxID=69181 RepID=A0ABQ7EMJ4_BRACR|nr:hypothetical protein DY000_02044783 [Brassica cretica]
MRRLYSEGRNFSQTKSESPATRKTEETDAEENVSAGVVKESIFAKHASGPQTGVPGIRHSTFESLRVGRSSQSIASNLLAYGIPWTLRKTVSLWESRFSSLMKRRANHYMPSLKAGSIVKVDRFEVARCGWANPICPRLKP